MKKIYFLICILCFSAMSIQAQNLKDVVYLKNGGIIHGVIIEQIPNQSIKIKTNDGNLFFYNLTEVEKMEKEEVANTKDNLQELKNVQCKYDINETDPISGNQHRSKLVNLETTIPFVTVGYWALLFDRNGDSFKINSSWQYAAQLPDDIVIGDSLIIKLDNGKIVKCFASAVSPKKSGYIDNQAVTIYKSFYPINIEDIKLLASSKAEFIRMHISAMHYDNKVKDKTAIKLQNAAACILQ